jgi:DNA repair exonuclease SbcCD ATPase subunit
MTKELMRRFQEFSDDTRTGVEIAMKLAAERSKQRVKRETDQLDQQLHPAYLKEKQLNRKLKQDLEEIREGLAALERQKRESVTKRFTLDSADIAQDDHKLKLAYRVLARAREELKVLRLHLEQSKRFDIVQVEDDILDLRRQLAALRQENQTLQGSSDLQVNALDLFKSQQSFEEKEAVLRAELERERRRYAELKTKLTQMQTAEKPRHDRYAELDLKVRTLTKTLEENAPSLAEVRLAETTKQADIMQKAVKTHSSAADRAIAEAEERLRALIMETNKSSAVLNERTQQLKLKELKAKELQAKAQQLQARLDFFAKSEAAKSSKESDQLRGSTIQTKPFLAGQAKPTVNAGTKTDGRIFVTEVRGGR